MEVVAEAMVCDFVLLCRFTLATSLQMMRIRRAKASKRFTAKS